VGEAASEQCAQATAPLLCSIVFLCNSPLNYLALLQSFGGGIGFLCLLVPLVPGLSGANQTKPNPDFKTKTKSKKYCYLHYKDKRRVQSCVACSQKQKLGPWLLSIHMASWWRHQFMGPLCPNSVYLWSLCGAWWVVRCLGSDEGLPTLPKDLLPRNTSPKRHLLGTQG
jgi:hypothetical protein